MNARTLRFFSWIMLAIVPVNAVVAAPIGQITQSSGYVAVSSPPGQPKATGGGEPIESGQTGAIASGSTLGAVVPAGAIPAGAFDELSAINLSAVGGSAVGSAAAAPGTLLGVPTSIVVGVGIAAAVAVAASNGGSTTPHH